MGRFIHKVGIHQIGLTGEYVAHKLDDDVDNKDQKGLYISSVVSRSFNSNSFENGYDLRMKLIYLRNYFYHKFRSKCT